MIGRDDHARRFARLEAMGKRFGICNNACRRNPPFLAVAVCQIAEPLATGTQDADT